MYVSIWNLNSCWYSLWWGGVPSSMYTLNSSMFPPSSLLHGISSILEAYIPFMIQILITMNFQSVG